VAAGHERVITIVEVLRQLVDDLSLPRRREPE
jgi:hypothetical protein